MKYCCYCGEEHTPEEVLGEHENQMHKRSEDFACYCPRCGDYLSEDATHCSCDKQD